MTSVGLSIFFKDIADKSKYSKTQINDKDLLQTAFFKEKNSD